MWFSASKQISTTQPLAYSLHSGMGERIQKKKFMSNVRQLYMQMIWMWNMENVPCSCPRTVACLDTREPKINSHI